MKIDDVVAKYLALREKKAALKRAYETDVASIDAVLKHTEKFFLAQMREQGLTSLPTEAGVPYQQHRTASPVEDWPSALNWIIKNERWDMLVKNVSKDAVEAYRNENEDLPPGIGWRDEIVVNVRSK